MAYRIGIDAGSKTIKIVVIDEQGTLVHSLYRRHRSDIKTTLAEALHDIIWRHGDIIGTVGITGSAGIGLAEMLGLPFTQEVIATTRAVQDAYPQADAVIELGGEDAKIVYLTGGLEQRMNATCAGGTGGFIDTIAFMLGTSSKNMSMLSLGANRIYPIASRCAVFAQTDIRPLLNAGARTSDLAASALEAVVRQTLGGLACGRPISGTVIFLGGPLEHIPDLVRRFRNALDLTHKTGIKPPDAHLFTARGAAMIAAEETAAAYTPTANVGTARAISSVDSAGTNDKTEKMNAIGAVGATDTKNKPTPLVSLAELEKRVQHVANPENDLVRLPPLFTSEDELTAFRARHEGNRIERIRLFDCTGPLYVGIDAGSTAVKLAVLDDAGRLAFSDYRLTEGDALKTAAAMLGDFYTALPHTQYRQPYAHVAHATVTGYGEDLLRAGLGIDSGVVETLAHVRAAQQFRPELTFLLDIGGQDMKAIWVRDGRVTNAILNEACSSGCGSFIEGTAHSLRSTTYRFAAEALTAQEPVDLGTKCTVFMTSRVRHAQKLGVSVADIAAGIAYSVVKNALFRIIGMNQTASMGACVVVQGGAFMSDAVLRSFELVGGVQVVRPDTAHLMGAIGAALTARNRAHAQQNAHTAVYTTAEINTPTDEIRSTLIGPAELATLKPKRTALRCPGCENACELSIVEFEEDKRFVSGNRCERAQFYVGGITVSHTQEHRPPNVIALEQKLIARFADTDGSLGRESACIGLMGTLSTYEQMPFWHTLFSKLGFSIAVVSDRRAQENGAAREGIGTIPSESVCYPAKLTHTRLYDLARMNVDAVFLPQYERGGRCPVTSGYGCALADSAPIVRSGLCKLLMPKLTALKPAVLCESEVNRATLLDCLNSFATACKVPTLDANELSCALEAGLDAQNAFFASLQRGNEHALAWAQHTGSRAVVLAGRPYHADPAILHGIDCVLTDVGFAVLTSHGLAEALSNSYTDEANIAQHAAHDTAGNTSVPNSTDHRIGRNTAIDTSTNVAPWKPGKHLVRLANLVVKYPQLELVCLQSFGCGYDAISLTEAHAVLDAAGRPFTALKIDDITDTAHIRIRLRTLAETLESETNTNRTQTLPHENACSKQQPNPLGSQDLPTPLLGTITQADLDTAQRSVPNDACFVVSALAGRAIRLLENNPTLQEIEIPAVCEQCLLDALPRIIQQATRRTPVIHWTNRWHTTYDDSHSLSEDIPQPTDANTSAVTDADSATRSNAYTTVSQSTTTDRNLSASLSDSSSVRPLIGIVGNALLCFDPFMNDHVVRFIKTQGCDVMLPDPELLFTDDVRYITQLDRFASQGVRHVIYLQSFGCLKGHVHARGALHELSHRYPTMPVTVIDFDPEASALNRENRIRLALAAAKTT